jgi:hypothetical protein
MLGFQVGVEKGDLGNGLGDNFPNRDFPLERGKLEISGVVVFLGNF